MSISKLANPAVVSAIATSPEGQKAISKSVETSNKAIEKTLEVVPFVLKTLFVLGVLGFAYYKFTNRFKPLSENSSYPNANITLSIAKSRADAIFSAMTGFGANVDLVANNIAGLNYNGFVRVFNAFGDKQGSIPFSSEMNMVEWFYDQFDEAELTKLRFLVPNVF